MKIDLRKAKSERLFVKENIDLDLDVVENPAKVDLNIYESNNIFVIRGKIFVTLNLECSRCLKIFQRDEEIPIFLVFKTEEYAPKGKKEKEVEIDEDNINTIFIDDTIVDIKKFLKNEILLQIPIKPLCRDDCEGLCPICGQNLNEGTCDCHKEKTDERMKKLQQIKEEMFGKEGG